MNREPKHFNYTFRIKVVFIHLINALYRCVYKEHRHRNLDLISLDVQI